MLLPGLTYIQNWIDPDTELKLLEKIQEGSWENSLQRRVQQFGPMYNYSNRKLNPAKQDIPVWLKEMLYPGLRSYFKSDPNQIIINEYERGQGITKHVDAPVFGPVIASLSLLSDTNMTFGQYRGDEHKLPLQRRSLVIMQDEARSKWYHYIAPVSEKRISITFRTTL